MNDPHVVALTYRVEHSVHVDFTKAPPRTVDNGAFRVTLDAGQARVEMLEHFATEKEACDAVEPFLREWELAADLKHPEDRFRFVYKPPPEIIDRSPPAGEVIEMGAALISVAGAGADFVAHTNYGSWPEPPVDIKISDLVKALHPRWLEYQERRDPFLLLAAAYWALTMIEAAPGFTQSPPRRYVTARRKQTSAFFKIDLDVLCTLGELSSTRGRKAGGMPLTPKEERWVNAAFKALVERAALQALHGKPPPTALTMNDLPDLT